MVHTTFYITHHISVNIDDSQINFIIVVHMFDEFFVHLGNYPQGVLNVKITWRAISNWLAVRCGSLPANC